MLCIAGITGICLAVVGWTQRDTGLAASAVTVPSSAATVSGAPSSPGAASSLSAAAGPQLSSRPYASFAYQVWPGPLTATQKVALSGWTLTVTRQDGGISVKATQGGRPMASVSHFYAGGAKVYVLDSDLGDDTVGGTDFNDTDDGLIVTNAQGQVLG